MQLTDNTRAFIENEIYSDLILTNLHDGLLPGTWYRNVSDFPAGETLHIKTIGDVTIQEAEEDTPLVYNPIETGEITFRITEYKGDAWYITDDLREDGTSIDRLLQERAAASTRAIQEVFETDFLATAGKFYEANPGPHEINGFPHLIVSAATGNVMQVRHFLRMRLAFDKANVPADGRVAIIDPVVEATLAGQVTITSDMTQPAVEILTGRGQRLLPWNLFGWQFVSSNRLYRGDFNDGTTSMSDGVANLFMCVADDNCKPIMGAWRRMPKSETERNKDRARDEFVTRCRYGFGLQREDTLGAVITSAVNFVPDTTTV